MRSERCLPTQSRATISSQIDDVHKKMEEIFDSWFGELGWVGGGVQNFEETRLARVGGELMVTIRLTGRGEALRLGKRRM